NTDFNPRSVVSALNANLENIWFHGFSEISDDLKLRFAKARWYRYHLPKNLNRRVLDEGARLFVGEHDFINYSKRSAGHTVRKIDGIEFSETDHVMLVDFRAKSFLWHMIRRIVSALLALESGRIKKRDIAGSLKGEKSYNFGLAAPEPLFLMDVEYGFKFESDMEINRRLDGHFEKELFKVKTHQMLLDTIKNNISR
ncbi:MAG: hypothetical protein KAI64_04220, partial [Thermoplasmata archaeon]|nr:hypothetical protein [Thermoplasmata archaeon]